LNGCINTENALWLQNGFWYYSSQKR